MLDQKKANYLFVREIADLIIPKEKVVTVDPDWSLERALLILTRKQTTSVPVIHPSGQVEGLISKTDILDFMLHIGRNDNHFDFSGLSNHRVREAMNLNHQGIMANSIFSFAFEILVNRSYIPIIDERNQFVGILTRKVLMEKVIKYFQEEYLQIVEDMQGKV
ncbi:CBS domain-containing protein [Seinonella peptonophila]|uniref:CBS domain-containing protein n=1 Tax=Seinonella peptonophila TaxID=112248 RepID=A0A1M4ZEB3_9BACL|nr:CBS domain-containing protein [Seinonella peptonophila]SHF16341.1 CBS domain-containing protein [Seinonella peptonophila]